ncbi:MAG TPA: geranylgeranyl reductase family protein [Ktedonobacteraceae bacterium]|nr:geranylgeranyl reductase family protein [Ktedonobacteraceae bacterium]
MQHGHLYQSPIDPACAESHDYDVLVVGAGPAGSSAAYHLARRGADVLLVDRHTFPRDKRCGDAVMPPALEELALMGLAEAMHERYFAATQISTAFYGLSSNFAKVDASEHFNVGYVAPRASFDAFLCEHALQAGASWLDRMTIHSVASTQREYAVIQGVHRGRPVQLHARIVIAADGSGSRLARQLRQELLELGDIVPLTAPENPKTRYTAMRGYYTGIEGLGDSLEFYFLPEAGTHYYWIFPLHDGLANVGVIASMEQLRAEHTDLTKALEHFLQSADSSGRARNATLQGSLGAAPIAAGLRGTALYGEHMLCVGDAAALVHPLSAEGISGALTSGRLAAETSLVALAQKDYSKAALSPYGVALRSRYQERYAALAETHLK